MEKLPSAELAHLQIFLRIELFRLTMGCELQGVVSRSTNSISVNWVSLQTWRLYPEIRLLLIHRTFLLSRGSIGNNLLSITHTTKLGSRSVYILSSPYHTYGITIDSCVSHSITAALGTFAVLTYDVQSAPKFSTQEMVDCIPIKRGRIPYDIGYEYVLLYGLHMEQDYPDLYEYGSTCRCSEFQGLRKYSFESNSTVDKEDVTATLDRHPVTAGILLYESFKKYCSPFVSTNDLMGVYSPLEGEGPCAGVISHVVLVVGYGYENGELFFIIKNSWGVACGVNGYARVACRLLYHFRFPVTFRTISPGNEQVT